MITAPTPEMLQPTLSVVMPILSCAFTPRKSSPRSVYVCGGAQKMTLLAIACFDGQIVRVEDIAEVTSYSMPQTQKCIRILVNEGLVERSPGYQNIPRLSINRTALRHRARTAT